MARHRKYKRAKGKKVYFTSKRGKKFAVYKKVKGRYVQMTKYG